MDKELYADVTRYEKLLAIAVENVAQFTATGPRYMLDLAIQDQQRHARSLNQAREAFRESEDLRLSK